MVFGTTICWGGHKFRFVYKAKENSTYTFRRVREGFIIDGTYATGRNNMISITSIRVHRWSFDEILAPLSLGQGGPLTRDEVIPTIMAAMNQMMGQLSSAEVQRLTRVISEIDLDEIFATRVGTFIVRGETLTLTLDGETSVKQRTYLQ